MIDEVRRMALVGSGIADLTKSRAEQIVKDLVKAGEIKRKQASGAVKELLEMSKENRKQLMQLLRSEVQNQIEGLGLATKRDVERLERRVARLEDRTKESRGAPARKKTSKKTTAKKPTRKTSSATGTANQTKESSG
jgi:polyhydroxyalkanoate synthesis regulator phasin